MLAIMLRNLVLMLLGSVNIASASVIILRREPATSSNESTSLLDQIISRGHLRVGTTGAYKPFTYLTNITNTTIGTDLIGADIDMALSLSEALGLSKPPEFIETAFANLTTDIANSRYDIGMSGISITLARALKTFFSIPVLRVGKAACVRCADVDKFQTIADIDQPGVKVATPDGGSNLVFDRANLKQADIEIYSDNNIIFQEVVDGNADVVITDVVEAQLQEILHPDVLCAVNPESPFSFEELGYILPRDTIWQEFVNQWLHIQQGSGAWNMTLQTWMEYPWPKV